MTWLLLALNQPLRAHTGPTNGPLKVYQSQPKVQSESVRVTQSLSELARVIQSQPESASVRESQGESARVWESLGESARVWESLGESVRARDRQSQPESARVRNNYKVDYLMRAKLLPLTSTA